MPWPCERPRPGGCAMVDRGSVEGLGLAEAIEALRDDLLKARAAGASSDIQLPGVDEGGADRHRHQVGGGWGGFRGPIVEGELGGGGSRERGTGQTVTVVFGGPVDREGKPVKVAQARTELKGEPGAVGAGGGPVGGGG